MKPRQRYTAEFKAQGVELIRNGKPSSHLLLGEPLPEKPIQVWALANHMRTELVSTALKQAIGSREVAPDLIIHIDRGSQYGSAAIVKS